MRARRARSMMVVLLAFVFAGAASSASAAPPGNDNFENAMVLTGYPVTITGNTTDGTVQDAEPSDHRPTVGATVWFSWTATESGRTLVDGCQIGGKPYVWGIAAYTGSEIDSLDSIESGRCLFTFEASAGITYRLALSTSPRNIFPRPDGSNLVSPIDDFSLTIGPLATPANDNFADAQVIPSPRITPRMTSTPGSLAGSTIEPEEPAPGFTTSVWYEWTAKVPGEMLAVVNDNPTVRVYTGSAIDSLTLIRTGGGGTSFPVDAGTTYRIAVAGTQWSEINRSEINRFVLEMQFSPTDKTPPIVNVSGPSGAVNSADTTFTFHDTEGDISDFYCRLSNMSGPPPVGTIIDFGPYQPCTSPVSFGIRPEGNYLFWVYAEDASGNKSAGFTFLQFRPFTIDLTAPEVSITSGPSGTTSASATSFAFVSPEDPEARYLLFWCQLDGAEFSRCSSKQAKVYGNLGPGTHTFTVRAIDPAGNFADATRTWTINPASTSTSSTGEVPPGGAVSTDPVGSGPTTAVPATASIIPPQGGTVEIIQDAAAGSPSPGFSVVGQRFQITAPDATVSEPLILSFRLDASAVPPGIEINELTMLRNGVAAADCSGPAGTATPDPCIQLRRSLPDGDVVLTVLSSHASEWFVAFAGESPACKSARSKLTSARKQLATARKRLKYAKKNVATASKAMKKDRKSGRPAKLGKAKRAVDAANDKLKKSKKKVKVASASVRKAKSAVTAACP